MYKYVTIDIGGTKYLARGVVRMYGNYAGTAAFWAVDLHRYIFTGEDKVLENTGFKKTGLRWELHQEEPQGEYVTDAQQLEEALQWTQLKARYLASYEKTLLDDGFMTKSGVKRAVAAEAEKNQTVDWYRARL